MTSIIGFAACAFFPPKTHIYSVSVTRIVTYCTHSQNGPSWNCIYICMSSKVSEGAFTPLRWWWLFPSAWHMLSKFCWAHCTLAVSRCTCQRPYSGTELNTMSKVDKYNGSIKLLIPVWYAMLATNIFLHDVLLCKCTICRVPTRNYSENQFAQVRWYNFDTTIDVNRSA